MIAQVLVRGAGPAGLSAALILHRHGCDVTMQSGPLGGGPVVVLNEVTLQMLAELWGYTASVLIDRLPRANPITERLVVWQAGEPDYLVKQAALAVPVADLAELMRADLPAMRIVSLNSSPPEHVDWVLKATGRPTPGDHESTRLAFGARRAMSVHVTLNRGTASNRCLLEALPGGWLFLVPLGGVQATLQAMSVLPFRDPDACLHSLLCKSRHVAAVVANTVSPCLAYPAMPSLQRQPAVPGEIAIGDAALSLDPISGDGVGSGLRSAMLANAVISAIESGEPLQHCLTHYQRRIELAARTHVSRCIAMYGHAHGALQAQAEIAAMAHGLSALPLNKDEFRYALHIGESKRSQLDRRPC